MMQKGETLLDLRHTLNPFLAVAPGKARGLVDSYKAVLGGGVARWILATDGKLLHAEIQIGDATLGLTEKLPVNDEYPGKGSYVWMITPHAASLNTAMALPDSGWTVTSAPETTPDGESIIMHAVDGSGTTWIFQQSLKSV